MADDIEILEIEDRERWIAAHRDAGLPSQSWHYAWALSASGIRPRLAILRSGGARMLLPFYEREWRGSIDVATLIGHSGASVIPNSDAPLSLWHEYAAAQGWVAGYIQLSTSVDLSAHTVAGELVDLNDWFVLDLRPENLFETFAEIVRRKVRRCSREGFVVVDDRPALSVSLRQLFPTAMDRVEARSHYQFGPETLDRWALDPSSIVLGASLENAIEAVSVFLVAGDEAEYHVNGCTERGRGLAAWLIWNAIVRLKDRGVRTLHLGGGVTRGDGLDQFKQKFRGTPKTLHAVRRIYDRPRYLELCRLADIPPTHHWFPAYRAARPAR